MFRLHYTGGPSPEQLVHLIRDRIGIKPLYYGIKMVVSILASEIKAIFNGMGSKNPRLITSHCIIILR